MLMDFFLLLNAFIVALSVVSVVGLKYAIRLNTNSSTLILFNLIVVSSIFSLTMQNGFFSLVLISFLIPSFIMLFYSLHRSQTVRLKIISTVYVIFISLLLILNSNNLLVMVFGFELIVFLTLYLLIITIKTDRGLIALVELFIWAIVGSFLLLTGLSIFLIYNLDSHYTMWEVSSIRTIGSFLLLLGFAVKIPLWPFTSWLLKAHVEASTEFSIFLSGFLVKFGVVIFWKIMFLFDFMYLSNLVLVLSTVGLLSASLSLLYQIDLKKIVALCTVIEMNWLVFSLFIGFDIVLFKLSLVLMFVHASMTTIEFYSVDILYRLYQTRVYFNMSGFAYICPLMSGLFWVMVFVIIGIPGTSVFTCKLLFFTYISHISKGFYVIWAIIFFIVLPIFFIKIWSSVLGSYVSRPLTLSPLTLPSSYDLAIFMFCLTINVLFGVGLFLVF